MNEDVIEIEITDTGLIKSTTPKISAANHANSAEFFKMLARLTGGEATATKRKDAHSHTHDHAHESDHIKGGQ